MRPRRNSPHEATLSTAGYILAGAVGAAFGAAGLYAYMNRSSAYAAPAAQIPGSQSVTLQDAVTATLIVPVDKTFTIYLPAGSKWVSLKNEAGAVIPVPSTGGPVNLPSTTDILTGIWLDAAGAAHQGAVSVTAQAPPSGA